MLNDVKMILKDNVENYENPFVGKRYFEHEKCYEELEKFRKFVLRNIKE